MTPSRPWEYILDGTVRTNSWDCWRKLQLLTELFRMASIFSSSADPLSTLLLYASNCWRSFRSRQVYTPTYTIKPPISLLHEGLSFLPLPTQRQGSRRGWGAIVQWQWGQTTTELPIEEKSTQFMWLDSVRWIPLGQQIYKSREVISQRTGKIIQNSFQTNSCQIILSIRLKLKAPQDLGQRIS